MRSAGQSLWLGELSRQSISDWSIVNNTEDWPFTGMALSTGALSRALSESDVYDAAIERKLGQGMYGELLAASVMYEDTRYLADLLRPVYDRTDGVDGWVVTPVNHLSSSADRSLTSRYQQTFEQIQRPNILLCLPALPDYLPDIEALIFAGVPLNISNIYSDMQYNTVAQACLRGIERRIEAGYKPAVPTFITVNIDALRLLLSQKTGTQNATELSLAMAKKIYRTLHQINNSHEWSRVFSAGVRPLRIVWNCLIIEQTPPIDEELCCRLITPCSVMNVPVDRAKGFVELPVDEQFMPLDGGDCDQMLMKTCADGLDVETEAAGLQHDFARRISSEWAVLLESFARKSASVIQVGAMQ